MTVTELCTDSVVEDIPCVTVDESCVCEESVFSRLLMDASRAYRYIGRRELAELSAIFDVPVEELHAMYLHRLFIGIQLSPLVVDQALLESVGM